MANKARGELGVVVGGRDYILFPHPNALCELEDLVGKPIREIMLGIQQGRLSGVRAVIWSLLYTKHRLEIKTLEDSTNWIMEAGGFNVALDWCNQVFELNKPPEGEATTDPLEAQSGTGEPSSSVLVGSV